MGIIIIKLIVMIKHGDGDILVLLNYMYIRLINIDQQHEFELKNNQFYY